MSSEAPIDEDYSDNTPLFTEAQEIWLKELIRKIAWQIVNSNAEGGEIGEEENED